MIHSESDDGLIPIAPGVSVSRETFRRLKIYETLLLRWQGRINLISNSTIASIWTRHFADSAQLPNILPTATSWVDLGSGAGFPGMVVGIQLLERQLAKVQLIEADPKKCAFLREVARETGVSAEIYQLSFWDGGCKEKDCEYCALRALI